jgi:hypothetical protein
MAHGICTIYANIIGKSIDTPKVVTENVEMTNAKVRYLVTLCQNAALSCAESRLYINFETIYVKR